MNWARPYIPLTTDMLSPFFQLLMKQQDPTSTLYLTPFLKQALQEINKKLSIVMVDQLPVSKVPLSLVIFVGKPYAFAAIIAIYNKKLYILEWLCSPRFSGRYVCSTDC